MIIVYNGRGTIEKPSDKRGYWDPTRFPTVAAFNALPRPVQDEVVVTCKRVGFQFALAIIPRSCT